MRNSVSECNIKHWLKVSARKRKLRSMVKLFTLLLGSGFMPLLLDLKVFVQLTTRQYLSFARGGGGGTWPKFGLGGCCPELDTLTLFMIKSSWKSWKIYSLFMIFRSNSTHFFHQNVGFVDPVYKISSKIFEFETLFMSRWSKNHTLKGGTSLYSLCMGVPPSPESFAQFTGMSFYSTIKLYQLFSSLG